MLKKEDIVWLKYNFPKICREREEAKNRLRKENPFYPFPPPPQEMLDAMKKWANEDSQDMKDKHDH